jgi:hypothetical protein
VEARNEERAALSSSTEERLTLVHQPAASQQRGDGDGGGGRGAEPREPCSGAWRPGAETAGRSARSLCVAWRGIVCVASRSNSTHASGDGSTCT